MFIYGGWQVTEYMPLCVGRGHFVNGRLLVTETVRAPLVTCPHFIAGRRESYIGMGAKPGYMQWLHMYIEYILPVCIIGREDGHLHLQHTCMNIDHGQAVGSSALVCVHSHQYIRQYSRVHARSTTISSNACCTSQHAMPYR